MWDKCLQQIQGKQVSVDGVPNKFVEEYKHRNRNDD